MNRSRPFAATPALISLGLHLMAAAALVGAAVAQSRNAASAASPTSVSAPQLATYFRAASDRLRDRPRGDA